MYDFPGFQNDVSSLQEYRTLFTSEVLYKEFWYTNKIYENQSDTVIKVGHQCCITLFLIQ